MINVRKAKCLWTAFMVLHVLYMYMQQTVAVLSVAFHDGSQSDQGRGSSVFREIFNHKIIFASCIGGKNETRKNFSTGEQSVYTCMHTCTCMNTVLS